MLAITKVPLRNHYNITFKGNKSFNAFELMANLQVYIGFHDEQVSGQNM